MLRPLLRRPQPAALPREGTARLLSIPQNPLPGRAEIGWTRSARGMLLRTALWPATGPCRGTVVLLQGRCDFIEKYFETVRELRRRGFAVATFDWRGQGGSGREISDTAASHVADFALYQADLDCVVEDLLADCPRPHLALGHSMGGCILIEALIANDETAFRMQATVPDVVDISREPEYIRRLYGLDSADEHQRLYATQALRARRLIESGVRFVEITCPSFDGNNSPWDQHGQIVQNHAKNATVTEQSVAALIVDLKARGLLDETIVIWAGEMGRTPHTPAVTPGCGRDHHVDGYSIFLAGGGFRGGMAYGETDDFGNSVVAGAVDIHDIHATILHQLGVDHERLTFRHGGRDHRLTDVHGRVIRDLLG